MPGLLEDLWSDLWRRLGAGGDGAGVFEDLRRRYEEPHRAYHTLRHIEHCLAEFGPARPLAAAPEAVELALWFHDAVYNPRASDNEERSAGLVLALAKSGTVPPAPAGRTADLILSTRHAEAPTDPDTRLLVDIDLAILGQPAERFDEYEEEVRREYSWVPGFLFRRKRAKLLRGFLARPALYSTRFFRERYETAARSNLERSIRALTG